MRKEYKVVKFPRDFSVPVLDEPFRRQFTQMIYSEDKTDYYNVNGGKPIPSFIVTNGCCGNSSGYIQGIENAEKEVGNRIRTSLEDSIIHFQEKLKRLKAAKKKFDKDGIKAFERER